MSVIIDSWLQCFIHNEIDIDTSCGDPTNNITILKQEILSGPTSINVGGTASIKCQAGYKWIDGAASKSISCSHAQSWNFPDGCNCMFLLWIYNF